MTEKLSSNAEFVDDLMNYSPYGGLCQVFILQAIRKVAQATLANPPSQEACGMVSAAAWNGVAKDIEDKFARRDAQREELDRPWREKYRRQELTNAVRNAKSNQDRSDASIALAAYEDQLVLEEQARANAKTPFGKALGAMLNAAAK
jgi:hypothetical protein